MIRSCIQRFVGIYMWYLNLMSIRTSSIFFKALQEYSKQDSQNHSDQVSTQTPTFNIRPLILSTPNSQTSKIPAISSPASCQLLIGSSKFGSQGRLFLWSCYGYLLCRIDHPNHPNHPRFINHHDPLRILTRPFFLGGMYPYNLMIYHVRM